MMLTVIEKLLLFQHKNHMTNIELSQELGITPVYLSMVLNNKRNLSGKMVDKIELLFKRYEFLE